MKKNIVFIVGPTAIGKTSLAVRLASSLHGEVISCDSMQVYKGMQILNQSPKYAKTKKCRYHLVEFLRPQEEFSVAAFIKRSSILINNLIKNKKVPIFAGGTGLYVKGLIDGLFVSPEADIKFRKSMYGYAKRYGSSKLHAKLKKIDAAASRSIHPNDTRRIVRALEIWHSTGSTMTELKKTTKGISDKYTIKIFGLTAPREKIYSNINDRVDEMLASGVINEVKRLSKKRLSKTAKAVLGYKEILGYLKDDYDLETAKELMKRNTRRFAKRQLTWFRADKRIKWFDVSKIKQSRIIKSIAKRSR